MFIKNYMEMFILKLNCIFLVHRYLQDEDEWLNNTSVRKYVNFFIIAVLGNLLLVIKLGRQNWSVMKLTPATTSQKNSQHSVWGSRHARKSHEC